MMPVRTIILPAFLLLAFMGCEFIGSSYSPSVIEEDVALTDTTWWVADIIDEDGTSIGKGDVDLYYIFESDGTIRGGGVAGSNSFVGTYEPTNDSLVVKSLRGSLKVPPSGTHEHIVAETIAGCGCEMRIDGAELILKGSRELVFETGPAPSDHPYWSSSE